MSGFAALYPTYSLFMTICQLEMVLVVSYQKEKEKETLALKTDD